MLVHQRLTRLCQWKSPGSGGGSSFERHKLVALLAIWDRPPEGGRKLLRQTAKTLVGCCCGEATSASVTGEGVDQFGALGACRNNRPQR